MRAALLLMASPLTLGFGLQRCNWYTITITYSHHIFYGIKSEQCDHQNSDSPSFVVTVHHSAQHEWRCSTVLYRGYSSTIFAALFLISTHHISAVSEQHVQLRLGHCVAHSLLRHPLQLNAIEATVMFHIARCNALHFLCITDNKCAICSPLSC